MKPGPKSIGTFYLINGGGDARHIRVIVTSVEKKNKRDEIFPNSARRIVIVGQGKIQSTRNYFDYSRQLYPAIYLRLSRRCSPAFFWRSESKNDLRG